MIISIFYSFTLEHEDLLIAFKQSTVASVRME